MAEWVVTFWDVGQGEATDICLPDGSHILIDTGPLARRQNPFPLWFEDVASGGRPLIRTIVLTHTHLDHFGGALTLCANAQQQINRVIMPFDVNIRNRGLNAVECVGEDERAALGRLLKLLQRRSGSTQTMVLADPLTVYEGDGLRLKIVRNPLLEGKSVNGSGLIILLETDCTSDPPVIVWSGDTLLGNVMSVVPNGIAGVLTGPHHGKPQDRIPVEPDDKKTSYFTKLCRGLHPRLLFVSVGSDNPYDHPYRKYMIGAAQAGITTCCSEVTRQCEKLHTGHVYQGSMALGLQPPEGACQCRGTMRVFVSAAGGLRLDEPCHSDFLKCVKKLMPRGLCQRTLVQSNRQDPQVGHAT